MTLVIHTQPKRDVLYEKVILINKLWAIEDDTTNIKLQHEKTDSYTCDIN